MSEKSILIEEEDENQVSSLEVSEFLKENKKDDEKPQDDTPEDLNKEEKETKSEYKDKDERISISPSKLYQPDKPQFDFNNLQVSVSDKVHPITNQDKEIYLESMLTEMPLHLDIKMKNGITITCRDLNMYERSLSLELAKDRIKEASMRPEMVLSILRDIRLPMQIVKVNNKPFKTIKFEFDPESSFDKFDKDKEELRRLSRNVLMPIPSVLQAMYTKALNVFEHKLAVLEESAFNSDFWNPVDTD